MGRGWRLSGSQRPPSAGPFGCHRLETPSSSRRCLVKPDTRDFIHPHAFGDFNSALLKKESSSKQAEGKVIEQPPAKTTEPWIITVGAPGWLALSVSGISGFRGANSNFSVDVAQILRNTNVIYSFGGEVRRGRFGALGDLLYVSAQAGQATPGLVSKL